MSQWSWHVYANRKGGHVYARRNTKGERLMHRLIMGSPVGMIVDHRDGDTLNNRRANLRVVTAQQNQWNRRATRMGASRFKGVSRDAKTGRWIAALSGFATEEDAARAVDGMARLLHGEYAALNFPEEAA